MSVYQNITSVCHYWPGITPLNVWELPYDMWLIFLAALRDIREARESQGG